MAKETKVATSNANEKVNAANAASIESINNSIMEKRATSKEESVRYYTRDELGRLGKDLEIKPTAVKASINGKTQTIVVAHTEYGMRHEKKVDKMLDCGKQG